MPALSWIDHPLDWDTVVIGDVRLFAQCEVGGTSARAYDVKKADGSNGAAITDLGREPATVEIKVKLWTIEHLAQWQKLLKLILPNGDVSVKAVEIIHPALWLHGIRAVHVGKVSVLRRSNVSGVFESTINATQFGKGLKNVTSTPKAAHGLDSETAAHKGRVILPSADAKVTGP